MCYFFITEFQMKTFMAQCATVLPLCHVISSFVLEWIHLYIMRWEVISANQLWECIGNGNGACSKWAGKGEQWNSRFYCYFIVWSPLAAEPFRGVWHQIQQWCHCPWWLWGTVSIQAVHLKPQELEILASLKMPFCAKFNYTRTVVSQTLAFCGGFCGSY